MSRALVSVRCAVPSDATFLAEVWCDVLRRDSDQRNADLLRVMETAASTEDRVVVAEYDGKPAGAVYLRIDTLSPLNLEPTLQVISPHVLPQYRRRGVGRALMEASVGYAEELGIAHLATAASSGSRDANRFMARLTFGPQAMLRVASTHLVRAKLSARRSSSHRPNARQLTQVLAARRSLRNIVQPEPPAPTLRPLSELGELAEAQLS